MGRLANKVAVITGGAGAIGAQTAKLYTDEGAKVLLVDLNEEALKKVVAELGHNHASYCVADVTDPEQTQTYVKTALERYDRIDILFSNAGIEGKVAPIADSNVEDFDKVMAVNVRAVWLSLKYSIPVMEKQGGGSIIITASIAGLHGFADLAPYVTSKHAVVGLMRSAAKEVSAKGIRVNSIHPAPIEGRMMRSIENGVAPGAGEQAKVGFASIIPAGRYGMPKEVGNLALFLASDESAYCTGGCFSVDGGMSAG
jgi:NAD(P)-dependent dehydrogenase (short-subunit alcohol dehydrogenase family)